ncbi:hypothetical protein C8R47DRAFT_1321508 [Mycena vitilis]|nr:hypothetical protein C8R47DRAFT_1321508 [Mycena vitilis]
MQFNVGFIVSALLVSSSPAMSVFVDCFSGADCTGDTVFGTGSNIPECLFFPGTDSAPSCQYMDVPNQIEFFVSGGGHDHCTNGPSLVRGAGSACVNAPPGFNWESFSWS